MSPRRAPADVIGQVVILSPVPGKSPYFRLKWTEPDGRPKDTTGGKTLDAAREKAVELSTRLELAAGPNAVATLLQLVEDFIAEGGSPFTGRPMKASYRKPTEDQLLRSIRRHEHLRAMDVTRSVLDVMRAQGGTPRMVRQNTTALRALLLWGYRHRNKYFTAAQAEMLPDGVVMPSPSIMGTQMPSRRRRGRTVGEAEDYVRPEDAPTPLQVICLGRELEADFPLWGRLAVEVAANSGPRWGEEFQLTAYDVHLKGCASFQDPHVHIDWQIDPGGDAKRPEGRRCLPKGDKTRVIAVPTTSITGYPLRAALQGRADIALLEQEAGCNPEALLFPAQKGGLLWYTSFESKKLIPAMQRAGWPLQPWLEIKDVWSKTTGASSTRVGGSRLTDLRTWWTGTRTGG